MKSITRNKKELLPTQRAELLQALQTRFEKNAGRPSGTGVDEGAGKAGSQARQTVVAP